MRGSIMLIMVLGSLLPALSLRAQAPPTDGGHNAATWYRRAFEQYHAVSSAMSKEQQMRIDAFTADPIGLRTPEIRQLMDRYLPAIELVSRAQAQPTCDFGGADSNDPFAPRDYLSDMRRLARMLHNDMILRMTEGDENTAIERTTAVLEMSGKIGQESALISHLVGAAMFALGGNMINELSENGLLSAENASRFLPLYRRPDPQDPFGYRQCLKNLPAETHWMVQQLENEAGRAKLIEHAEWFVGDDLMAQWQLAGTSPENWRAALEKVEAVTARIGTMCDEPDLEKMKVALASIDDEIKRGDHGPLAEGLVGFYRNMPIQMELGSKMLRETREMLESVAAGRIDPKSLGNAAMLYLRAIKLINAIDPAHLEQVRRCADAAEAMNDQVSQTLKDSQPIVDLLRQASTLKKCKFQFWDSFGRHQPGLRDAARLLLADARRTSTNGDLAPAIDRCSIVLRMAGHLSMQKEILCSLVAQVNVNAADAAIAAAAAGGKLSDAQLTMLAEALEALRDDDPFGLVSAIDTERQSWRQYFAREWVGHETDEVRIKRATVFASQCPPDQLLWFDFATNEAYADLKYSRNSPMQYVGPLRDILALDVMAAALPEVQTVRTIMENGDFERLGDLEYPIIAHVQEHLDRARADLHRVRSRVPRPETAVPMQN